MSLLNRLKIWRRLTVLGLLAFATGQLAEQHMARAAEVAHAQAQARRNADHTAASHLPAPAYQAPSYSAFTTSAIDPQFDLVYAGIGQSREQPAH